MDFQRGRPRPLTAGYAGTCEHYDHPSYYPQPTDPWFRDPLHRAVGTDCALPAGIIRAQEMRSGTINDALFMTVDCTTGNPVYPAQGGGTACRTPTNAPAGANALPA